MSLWRQITRGLHALLRPSAADQDVADELQSYLDQATAEHMSRGLARDEARRMARLEMGSATGARQLVRESGWENKIESLAADLRHGVRRLWADLGFTVVAVLTLAVGIGGVTAIFSVVNPILFQPLPYPQASRVTMVWDAGQDGSRVDLAFGNYLELAGRSRSFETLAAMKSWQPTLVGAAEPERLEGQQVSASYFQALGIPPILGRGFQPADDQQGGSNVVVLSDALWRHRFAGDPAIIGQPVILDGDLYVVIGVMPKSFENVPAPQAAIWAPLQYDITQGRAWGHHLHVVGRLKAGVTIAHARDELSAIARAAVPEFPRMAWASFRNGVIVSSLQDDVTRDSKPALHAILGAVFLVLLIACVNVTNLLLAQGVRRRAEFALRASLGAGQGRLVRQLLTENLLLALVGGAIGMAVALFGVRALVALSPPGLPRVDSIRVDGSVFAFGLAITTLIGLGFGLIPARQASRSDPQQALQQGSRRSAGGHRRTRGALVVAEVGLALMLLVSSGLLLRSLQRLFAVSTGFDSTDGLTIQVQISGSRFSSAAVASQFYSQVLDAAHAVPGVKAAALTSQLPLSGDIDKYGVKFDPPVTDDPGEVSGTYRYGVSPGYHEVMGIPLKKGRLLSPRDGADAPKVALVSESFTARRLRGLDPIGRRIIIGSDPPYEIVGVVGDVRQVSLALNEREAVYVTEPQWRAGPDMAMSLVVRATGDAASLAPAIRQAVWSVDKDQPVTRIATMRALLRASAAERRFALILFEAFALAALVLAAAGIYGVLAGGVAERAREIGVRSALGATRGGILALVLRQGMTLTGLGVALGLVGAIVTTRALTAMLFGISRLDPATYASVVALLFSVAMIACGVPAWRAARVDPARTLRTE